MKKAIYAGSFDPITNGHKNVIERIARITKQLVVAVGINPEKKYTFTLRERTNMALKALSHLPNVEVTSFQGLLVDYAYEHGIPVIVRGVRNGKDYDDELSLHLVNQSQKLGIETIFLPAKKDIVHVSSSATKALQKEKGIIFEFVSLYVKQCLEARMSGQYIVGITGAQGAGKSFICKKFEKIGQEKDIPTFRIELDDLADQILSRLKQSSYQRVREEIGERFGNEVLLESGMIDKKKLGEIVFAKASRIKELHKIMEAPILTRLRRELYGKRGLILLVTSLMAEVHTMYLCNNNLVLIKSDSSIVEKRLQGQGLASPQITRRLENQANSPDRKKRQIKNTIDKENQGQFWQIDNNQSNADEDYFDKAYLEIFSEVDIYGELTFKAMCSRLGMMDSEQMYRDLLASYSQIQRTYHTLEHVMRGVKILLQQYIDKPYFDEILYAWWYHDFIYEGNRSDNEEKSAEVAISYCRRFDVPAKFIEKIHRLILATQHKTPPRRSEEKLIVDLDLAIFGGSLSQFKEYEQQIREEYKWLPDAIFYPKRAELLKKFLHRPQIFYTDYFYKNYEKQARQNLTESLEYIESISF